jgi:hypothetical protein
MSRILNSRFRFKEPIKKITRPIPLTTVITTIPVVEVVTPIKEMEVEEIIEKAENIEQPINKNNKIKKKTVMITEEKIDKVSDILNIDLDNEVELLKSDKGLIERVKSSKKVITEDNRQLLND